MEVTLKRPREGTQRAIILNALIEARGDYVGLNHFMYIAHCGAVHSQMAELRSLYGADILNAQAKADDGRTLSKYKLINWQDFTPNQPRHVSDILGEILDA